MSLLKMNQLIWNIQIYIYHQAHIFRNNFIASSFIVALPDRLTVRYNIAAHTVVGRGKFLVRLQTSVRLH
jgi:hypothetical protein